LLLIVILENKQLGFVGHVYREKTGLEKLLLTRKLENAEQEGVKGQNMRIRRAV